MDLSDVQDGTININLLGTQGKTFSWVCRHKPDVIVWGQRKVPECSTDLFRLIQYAEFHRYGANAVVLERKWSRLRDAHHEHMRARQERQTGTRITRTDVNGYVKKRKLNHSWDKFGFQD